MADNTDGTADDAAKDADKDADKGTDQKSPDAAALTRELEAARKEAAKWRTDHKKLADAAAEAAKAKMTEDEKKAADLADKEKSIAERESKALDRIISAAIKEAAAAAGVPAAKLALMPRLIDRASVEVDDEGEPKNVKALVDALLAEHPDFKAAAGTVGNGGGSADAGHRGKSTLTREAIEKMTPAEINQRWDEVSAFLSRQGRA